MKQAKGFVSFYVIAEEGGNVAISFWESKADADAFRAEAESWGKTLHPSPQVGLHIPLIVLSVFSAHFHRLITALTGKVGESSCEKGDNFRHRCEPNM